MTFDQFIAQWTNRPVNTDGVYPNQCMDLMHQYCTDVLGLPLSALAAWSAYQAYLDNNRPDVFEKIKNTPSFIPQKGDIIFWDTKVGTWGHVAIYIDGDVNSFRSFDANWPVGTLPHIQSHNYYGVAGVLRPKNTAPVPIPEPTVIPFVGTIKAKVDTQVRKSPVQPLDQNAPLWMLKKDQGFGVVGYTDAGLDVRGNRKWWKLQSANTEWVDDAGASLVVEPTPPAVDYRVRIEEIENRLDKYDQKLRNLKEIL